MKSKKNTSPVRSRDKVLQSLYEIDLGGSTVEEILEDKRISECMAIEGFCALHLIDDIPKYSVSFGDSKNCFLVNKKDSIINHSQIEKTELIQL